MRQRQAAASYIPPLRFHFLTRAYDRLIALSTREARWRPQLHSVLAGEPGSRILDVGCGTGSTLVRLAQADATARVVGIDRDAVALQIAREKTAGPGAAAGMVRCTAESLPFADATFDSAVSSLFFHHLARPAKRRVLAEIHRVMRPGALLVVADWGEASGLATRLGFMIVRMLDGFGPTEDSVKGSLPLLIAGAGFAAVREASSVATPLGVVRIWTASRDGAR